MKRRNFIKTMFKTALIGALTLFACTNLLAQYKGNPVKKEKL